MAGSRSEVIAVKFPVRKQKWPATRTPANPFAFFRILSCPFAIGRAIDLRCLANWAGE
jgi:hypothetical protein